MRIEVIPLTPDWQRILRDLNTKFCSDDGICDELARRYGVLIDRSSIAKIRTGAHLQPMRFYVAAAILNLDEESKGEVVKRRRKGCKPRSSCWRSLPPIDPSRMLEERAR